MSNYITTHNAEGQAVYSTKVPEAQHTIKFPGGEMRLLYSNHQNKPNLSTEADIDQYAHDRINGLPNGAFTPPEGAAVGITSFEPNSVTVFHRTMTLDFHVVLEGSIECQLDSGEVRTLNAGDSIIQRGSMHVWKNVTPNDGWVRLVSTAQPIVQPLEVGGKTLGTEYNIDHRPS